MLSLDASGSFASCTEEPVSDSSEDTYEIDVPTSETCRSCFGVANAVEIVGQQTDNREMANRCISEQIHSNAVSRFNLPNNVESLVDLSLETAFDEYRQQQEIFSSMLEDTKEEDDTAQISDNILLSTSESQKNKLTEELEYQGFETEGLSCQSLSSLQEVNASATDGGTEVPKMIETFFKAANDLASDSEHTEETSFTSAFDSVDIVSSDQVIIANYKADECTPGNDYAMQQTEWNAPKCEEAIVHNSNPPFFGTFQGSVGEANTEGSESIADIILTDLTDGCQILEKVELYGNVEGLNDNGDFQDYGNRYTQTWQQYGMESMQISQDTLNSSPDIFDDSFQSALSDSSFDSIPALDHSCISTMGEQPYFEKNAPTAVAADGFSVQVHIPDNDLQCLHCLKSAAGDSKVTVSQVVDASSDFRNCFTISRSTTTERSSVSRANNTEVTLINKCSSKRWQAKEYRSVSCNTDFTSDRGLMQDVGSQTVSVYSQEKTVNTDVAVLDWTLSQDSLQVTGSIKHSKENPQRTKEVSEGTERPRFFRCCVDILERAVKAELQLLNTYHWMCRERCWQMYKHAMEERGPFNRSPLTGSFTESEFALSPALDELKKKYDILKEQLLHGTPLDDLPQLSIKVKNKLAFTDYIPSEIMKADIQSDVGRLQSELGIQKQNNIRISDFPKTISLITTQIEVQTGTSEETDTSTNQTATTTYSESSQDTQYASLLDVEFIGVDNKNAAKTQNVNEGWFDAKEELTLNETCGTLHFDQLKAGIPKPGSQGELKVCKTSGCESGKQCYVHVAGLPPSTSEEELRSHFRTYGVSEVFIEQFSLESCYAILFFNTTHEAQVALEEMNGKSVNGKVVKLRLINVAEETSFKIHSSHHGFNKNMVTQNAYCDLPFEADPALNRLTEGDPPLNLSTHVGPSQKQSLESSLSTDPLKVSGLSPHSDTPPPTCKANYFSQDPRSSLKTTPLPWKVTHCASTPLMMPGQFPPPWSIPGSYPNPCWQVPGSKPGHWSIPNPSYNWLGLSSFQSPWPGPSSMQIPLSGNASPNLSRQLPSFPHSSWSSNTFSPTVPNATSSVKTSTNFTSSTNAISKGTSASKDTFYFGTPSKGTAHTHTPSNIVGLGSVKSTSIATVPITGFSVTSCKGGKCSTSSSKDILSAPASSKASSSTLAPTTNSSISKPSKITIPKVRITAAGLRKQVSSSKPHSKVTRSTPAASAKYTIADNTIVGPDSVSSIVINPAAALTTVIDSISACGIVTSCTPTCSEGEIPASTYNTFSSSAAITETQCSSGPSLVSAKNLEQAKSEMCPPSDPAPFIPQNTVNVGSLTKLIKKLLNLHPDATRKQILEALAEVRANNNGFLTGLPLDAIVVMASSVLTQSAVVPGKM
ncbi:RNA-binding protein 44 [Ambystoma mexicanum]|uniref:RNA-binding protein 44 n=1 Tax=Ambystoma mexicanum TaxID=8296 RepID=UPI0037E7CEE6